MSSHHIVREKQEPALLILGLDDFSEEMLGQLLEWSPTVITTPLTAEQINTFGIKIDVIITDDADEHLQSDVKVVPAGSNPVDAAMHYLIAKGYPAVNIVTDNFELNSIERFADQINLVLFSDGKKIFAISSGFSKWKPADENIEILSPSLSLQTTGLEGGGGNKFRTTNDGFVTFVFNEPFLFIAEEV